MGLLHRSLHDLTKGWPHEGVVKRMLDGINDGWKWARIE